MGMEDLFSTESALAAGITATVLSPRARETVRRGAVLGVAGVLKAGDVVTAAARGVARGARGEETAPTPSGPSAGEPGSDVTEPVR